MKPTSALVATLIAGLLLPLPTWAQARADQPTPPPSFVARVFDAVVLRPVGVAAAAVGVGFFVPAAILSAPGGRDSVVQAWEIFVLAPGTFAFQRPMGEF